LPFVAAINNVKNAVDKMNPAILENCASNFVYSNGLEKQQAIIDEPIEEVNNKWSIVNGENGNNTGNLNTNARICE
jgi:hypothetical protein